MHHIKKNFLATPEPMPLHLNTFNPNLKILVIDDDEVDRLIVKRFLKEHFCVFEANDGTSGYEQALEIQPACVLLDFHLPDVLDTELLKKLLKLDCPVILLSGNESPRLALECLRNGASDCLVKGSFSAKDLIEILNRAIEAHQETSELRRRLHQAQEAFITLTHESVRQLAILEKRGVDGTERQVQSEHTFSTVEKTARMFDSVDFAEPLWESDLGELFSREHLAKCFRLSADQICLERLPIIGCFPTQLRWLVEKTIHQIATVLEREFRAVHVDSYFKNDRWEIAFGFQEDGLAYPIHNVASWCRSNMSPYEVIVFDRSVRLHDADITLRPADGKGTVELVFDLPVLQPSEQQKDIVTHVDSP